MVLFFFAMLVCDFAVVYLAIVLFIKPLEQMARHLKRAQGTTFDLDHLRSLAKRKKFLGFVLALGLASPAISIAFLMWEKNVLHTAFIDRSSSEPGLLAVSAKVRPQQLVLVSNTIPQLTHIRGFYVCAMECATVCVCQCALL
jgi:hypothetical protein